MHFNGKSEREARAEILGLVKEYCDTYHNQKQWKEGDRISFDMKMEEGTLWLTRK